MQIEKLIFANLLNREAYGRKVIPFIKADYFQDQSDKLLFKLIDEYVGKYNRFPTREVLNVTLQDHSGISQSQFDATKQTINTIEYDSESDLTWLVDTTEKWCQEKAVYNAILNSIQIIDGKDTKTTKGAIPQILSEALAISFDSHIGHNWIDDSSDRYDFYHRKEARIPFNLSFLNKITKGGLPTKTLNIILAGTGVGKSLFMCHCAASNLLDGKNVLYITMEMAEERIAERIDANLMNISLEDLSDLSKEQYTAKVDRISRKTNGKLIIKEYPTSTAGSANFRHLLNELKIKKNFAPDIIYIDYLNICASSRIKQGAMVNSYTYIKSIAEELRGLAVEFVVPIVSATQTTRAGFASSDLGLEDTSESFGLPATSDFMIALISSEELEGLNQIMVKQLKNRYADPTKYRRFVIGVDKSKMKLYDVEETAQEGIMDDRPVMDKTGFGQRDDGRNKKKSKFDINQFDDFN